MTGWQQVVVAVSIVLAVYMLVVGVGALLGRFLGEVQRRLLRDLRTMVELEQQDAAAERHDGSAAESDDFYRGYLRALDVVLEELGAWTAELDRLYEAEEVQR